MVQAVNVATLCTLSHVGSTVGQITGAADDEIVITYRFLTYRAVCHICLGHRLIT
jgi:hypothetical protein